MKVKSIGRLAAVGFAAAVAASMVASPAAADPNPITEYRILAGTGSDTTQDVMNGMGVTVLSGGNRVIASWDARGTANIKTKPDNCHGGVGAAQFARPNGSTNGRRSLRASQGEDIGQGGPGFWANADVVDCVDFARSSSYGGGTVPSAVGNYTYIPFGVDALSLARNVNGDHPSNISFAQEQRVYRCFDTAIAGTPVQPVMIQAGSGTWEFWMQRVGITEVEIGLGDYPCMAPGGVPIIPRAQEHDGTVLNGFLNRVVPFSAAQFLAQGNAATILAETGVTVVDRRGEAALTGTRLPGGTLQQPIVGGILNINYPLRRDVYNVVPTADLAVPIIDSTFTGADSAVCNVSVDVGGVQRTVIELFGFGKRTAQLDPLNAACGYTDLRFNS